MINGVLTTSKLIKVKVISLNNQSEAMIPYYYNKEKAQSLKVMLFQLFSLQKLLEINLLSLEVLFNLLIGMETGPITLSFGILK